jgi:hypothetical protein
MATKNTTTLYTLARYDMAGTQSLPPTPAAIAAHAGSDLHATFSDSWADLDELLVEPRIPRWRTIRFSCVGAYQNGAHIPVVTLPFLPYCTTAQCW